MSEIINEVIKHKDYCELIIKKGEDDVANSVFSKRHFHKVKKHKWFIWIKNNKYGKSYYYIATKRYSAKLKKQRTYYLHHLIMGKPDWPNVIDHINRNTFDNRDLNLRFATRNENAKNSDCNLI